MQSVPVPITRGDVRRAPGAAGSGQPCSAGRDFAGRRRAADHTTGVPGDDAAGDGAAGRRPCGGAATRVRSGQPPEVHAHGGREVLGESMPWDTFVREQAEP
ncbi:hypothetical protein GCM10009610_35300 [Pseudonocardia xinjiangensis]